MVRQNFVHSQASALIVNGNTADFVSNGDPASAHIAIDITAIAGGSLTFTVEGKDPASGKYYTLLATAALAGTGTTILRIFPGATAVANLAANDIMPGIFRVKWVITTTPTATFTIGAALTN